MQNVKSVSIKSWCRDKVALYGSTTTSDTLSQTGGRSVWDWDLEFGARMVDRMGGQTDKQTNKGSIRRMELRYLRKPDG